MNLSITLLSKKFSSEAGRRLSLTQCTDCQTGAAGGMADDQVAWDPTCVSCLTGSQPCSHGRPSMPRGSVALPISVNVSFFL